MFINNLLRFPKYFVSHIARDATPHHFLQCMLGIDEIHSPAPLVCVALHEADSTIATFSSLRP